MSAPVIALFSDFGLEGPYIGQMKAVLHRDAPNVPVLDLFSDLPIWNIKAAAFLLAAYGTGLPRGSVVLAVVDPGVGGARLPAAVEADGLWYVGPDNGVFELVVRRAKTVTWWDITWTPPDLSASFHGRDLFAPVAAQLAAGKAPPGNQVPVAQRRMTDWPDDLYEIVYVDRFGNGITGVRATALDPKGLLHVGGVRVPPARTFSDVPMGTPFWYQNANGLAEIAANQDRADKVLGFSVGSDILGPGA